MYKIKGNWEEPLRFRLNVLSKNPFLSSKIVSKGTRRTMRVNNNNNLLCYCFLLNLNFICWINIFRVYLIDFAQSSFCFSPFRKTTYFDSNCHLLIIVLGVPVFIDIMFFNHFCCWCVFFNIIFFFSWYVIIVFVKDMPWFCKIKSCNCNYKRGTQVFLLRKNLKIRLSPSIKSIWCRFRRPIAFWVLVETKGEKQKRAFSCLSGVRDSGQRLLFLRNWHKAS